MEAKSGASFAETVKRLNYPWGRLTKGDDSGRGEAVEIEADGAKIGHSFIARQTLRLRKSFESTQTEQRQARLLAKLAKSSKCRGANTQQFAQVPNSAYSDQR